MKLVTFEAAPGGPRAGALLDGKLVELAGTVLELIREGAAGLERARRTVEKPPDGARRLLKDIRLKAPLPDPPALRDFFAFEEHAKAGAKRRGEELPREWYEIPAYYKGNPREVYGPEDTIPWPWYTRRLDFECEVACVVGRQGRDLTPEQAAEHIFGYMIFNDVSARDIQKKEMRLRMGPSKGKDFANVFGPWLVTADEVAPRELTMQVRLNGELLSEGRFADQYWGFPAMVAYVSQEETVYPGDVFGSGTFYKGCGLDLDRWVKPGDVLEMEVPGLGTLRNTIGKPIRQEEISSLIRPSATFSRPSAGRRE